VHRSAPQLPEIDRHSREEVRAQALQHLARSDGIDWKSFEEQTRQTVTDYVGVRRTDAGLRLALATLRALAREERRLRADDLHGLMRVHESRNIRLNAEMMASASLARRETRTGSAHWRLDYPHADEANWRRFVIVERGDNGPSVRTLSTARPLADAFARSHATI
jgi:succinate dehydrogenase/fumarate reductase flavoprotein subunit